MAHLSMLYHQLEVFWSPQAITLPAWQFVFPVPCLFHSLVAPWFHWIRKLFKRLFLSEKNPKPYCSAGWWFGTYIFPNSWDDDPIWRTPSFFQGVRLKPPTRYHYKALLNFTIPSGKRLHNYGKIHHFIAGKIHDFWPYQPSHPKAGLLESFGPRWLEELLAILQHDRGRRRTLRKPQPWDGLGVLRWAMELVN